uniref:FHA domain-containing protein n=1 Tax=Cajanus cajan TaxID=3821 RepID=A0A151QT36_CAJCA|nr:hypothetical protein KK1_045711 [Cajanus cajan]
MLTHPSISRYHLQIRSKPSTRHFSVVDLSSVHGTWVSGRRIEAMVSVEMREGDSLRIGASSRVYRLHWIPISRAYDMENPFVAQLDAVAEEEEEEEEMQNLNSCHAEMEEIESVDSVIEDISSLFLHENAELAVKEDIPSAPWMLKDMVSLCFEEERKSPSKAEAIGIPSSVSPIQNQIESVNLSMPQEPVLTIKNENQTLQSDMEILESCVKAMEKTSSNHNIWSRREEVFTPDKENSSPNTLQLQFLKGMGSTLCQMNQKDILNRAISKDLFSDLGEEEEEEEMFTPDKENFSPNTLQLQLLKKKGKVEEIKLSKSPWPQNSKDNFGCNIYPNENMSSTSSKEYQTAKVTQGQNLQRNPFSSHIKLAQEQEGVPFKNRVERVPLQSLKNSGGKRRSSTFCPVPAAKSFNFSNCGQILDQPINPFDINGVPKRSSWDMIVDTTSLMNKESRKALQLLQGLKGTRLIIPRLVIRELDSMKQQFSIFRRISEASLALEWIQECMVKTNWWIHIQNSVDEGRMIAPTPPASPQTQFSEECWTFLSSQKCAMEIASPTVEDHILEFALLYRKNQNDGQLVLLSEDVTLKIKCMEEGLLCEPVQEFRESLVNPFSERFLWTNSSPRGQTWSCQDDVVLREKYCRLPLWKSSKGVASGLKLILLHNSQYGL